MIEILFFMFSGVILLGMIGLIFTKNVIHAAFILVVVLIALAGVYVVFQAEYLAVVQLLVYAGGVVILLAFGLMLTQQVKEGASITVHHLIFPGILLVVTVGFAFSKALMESQSLLHKKGKNENIEEPVWSIGKLLMTDYILAFELIAFLLLVVLVGASYYSHQSSKVRE